MLNGGHQQRLVSCLVAFGAYATVTSKSSNEEDSLLTAAMVSAATARRLFRAGWLNVRRGVLRFACQARVAVTR